MSTKADKLAGTMMSYLKGAGELKSLRAIVGALMATPEYKSSLNQVVVTSAVKLEPASLKQIESYVVKQVGVEYTLTEVVDPSLIAGFTLQVNDTLIDASFLGKVTTIEHSLQTKE